MDHDGCQFVHTINNRKKSISGIHRYYTEYAVKATKFNRKSINHN